jgi:hypothetical protein
VIIEEVERYWEVADTSYASEVTRLPGGGGSFLPPFAALNPLLLAHWFFSAAPFEAFNAAAQQATSAVVSG